MIKSVVIGPNDKFPAYKEMSELPGKSYYGKQFSASREVVLLYGCQDVATITNDFFLSILQL